MQHPRRSRQVLARVGLLSFSLLAPVACATAGKSGAPGAGPPSEFGAGAAASAAASASASATSSGSADATGNNTVTKVTSVEGITEYRLDNGLQVLLFPDQSKPTVTVNLTYLVGSRHEGYGETGMAHLLEHMVFKGTPSRPDIPKLLQDHGAKFNGTTWVDRTNYYEDAAGHRREPGVRHPTWKPTAWSTASSPRKTWPPN